jgi:hypothetical protein
LHDVHGTLPDGKPARVKLRVTRPNALVLLKLLALDDRYRNLRGPEHAQHDRDEAIVHASDIIVILNAVVDITALRQAFYGQFAEDVELGIRATDHLRTYFREDASPGMLLYEESLRAGAPIDRDSRAQLADEFLRAARMMAEIVSSEAFSALRFAIHDVCNIDQRRTPAEDFLRGLANAGVPVSSEQAIQFFPGEVFGGAYHRGQVFQTSAHEVQKLGKGERTLLTGYWKIKSAVLLNDVTFKEQFGRIIA